jgi:hypothetical protein
MFGGNSLMMYVVIGMGVALLISAGVVKYEMNKNDEQLQVITAMKISDQMQKAAISQLQSDSEAIQNIDTGLAALATVLDNQELKLSNTLSKLEQAAVANPAAVELAINAASDKRNRCFALVTGAAKLKNETNSVCPQLMGRK